MNSSPTIAPITDRPEEMRRPPSRIEIAKPWNTRRSLGAMATAERMVHESTATNSAGLPTNGPTLVTDSGSTRRAVPVRR